MMNADEVKEYVKYLVSGGHHGSTPPEALLVIVAAKLRIPLSLAAQWRDETPDLWPAAVAVASAITRAEEVVRDSLERRRG